MTPIRSLVLANLLFALVIAAQPAYAHCDAMDGPVVKAAQQALATGDVNLVLIWVKAQNEAEVRKALANALTVRKLSREARELADYYFFETVVRSTGLARTSRTQG
jgi:hypothetical protein